MNTFLPDNATSLPIPTVYYCPSCGIESPGNSGVEYHCVRCNGVLVEANGDLGASDIVDIYVRALPILQLSLLCVRCGRTEHDHEPTRQCLTFHPALFGRRAA